MVWKKTAHPSPLQMLQRDRYFFKGFLTGSISRMSGLSKSPSLSIREKIVMVDTISLFHNLLSNYDDTYAVMKKGKKDE